MDKLEFGQFNTVNRSWLKPHILRFIVECGVSVIVDPFAGKGDLLAVAKDLGFKSIGYDIDPDLSWKINDSLINVPEHKDALVITNPPYLAKVSARRTGKSNVKYFESNTYSDLYQLAIEKVLFKYKKSVFIVPETFILTNLFRNCISNITILEENPFIDTECPVCVVCFDVDNEFKNVVFDIYKNDLFLFDNNSFEHILNGFKSPEILDVKFNVKNGNLGLRGIDGLSEDDKIRFCLPDDLNYDVNKIKHSSRAVTLLHVCEVGGNQVDISELVLSANQVLSEFRVATRDVALAPFKNNNRLGERRRRLDFFWARHILNKAAVEL